MILEISPDAPLVIRAAAGGLLFAHIAGGATGIVSGWVAILARKGGQLHRMAGTVFFGAMLVMAAIGAAISPFLPTAQWTNTTAGVFTFYLVATAWMTVRRRPGEIGRFERVAFLVPAGIAAMALALAAIYAGSPRLGGFTTVFVFAAVAAIAAVCDFRMVRQGGLAGPARVARHLWRMGLALVIATGSFFLGQPEFMPAPIRGGPIPALPVIAALALMAFWLIRTRLTKPRSLAAAASMSLFVVATSLLVVNFAEAGGYKAPRTPFGAPDLQGIWTNTSLTWLQRTPACKSSIATDAEAATVETGFQKFVGALLSSDPIDPNLPAPPVVKQVANADNIEMDMHLARVGGQLRCSWIVDPADGMLPFTDAGKKAAQAAAKESFDGPEGRPLMERCLVAVGSPEGPPMMNTGFNGHYRIVQTKDHVAIEIEMNHDVRIIRLKDRGHGPEAVRPWMGDSVGWWEGQTLVVETTNLEPRTYIGSLTGSFVYSPDAKLTERFTRTAKDQILYEFSVDDPVMFTRPWRAEQPWRTAKGPIYEYACHEGNYSLANALTGARFEEQSAARAGGQ